MPGLHLAARDERSAHARVTYPYQLVIHAIPVSALVIGGVLAVAARRSEHVRPWVAVAAIGVAALPVAIILHNVASALIEGEEGVSFVVALAVAPLVIAIGLAGSARALLRERRDLGIGIALGAAGVGLFAGYMALLFVVTSIVRGNPEWQAASDAIVMTAAALAAVGGALLSILVLARGARPATA